MPSRPASPHMFSVKWLTRWFETRTLTPFAIYSLTVGIISVVHFA